VGAADDDLTLPRWGSFPLRRLHRLPTGLPFLFLAFSLRFSYATGKCFGGLFLGFLRGTGTGTGMHLYTGLKRVRLTATQPGRKGRAQATAAQGTAVQRAKNRAEEVSAACLTTHTSHSLCEAPSRATIGGRADRRARGEHWPLIMWNSRILSLKQHHRKSNWSGQFGTLKGILTTCSRLYGCLRCACLKLLSRSTRTRSLPLRMTAAVSVACRRERRVQRMDKRRKRRTAIGMRVLHT
jgi:hypothetical protein